MKRIFKDLLIELESTRINNPTSVLHVSFFEALKFVEYGESMPEIVKTQVVMMLQEHFYEEYTEESEEREQFDTAMVVWATSPKRELQERLDTNQVMEAAAQIIEHTPESDLRLKLDH